jgi:hypothetical protein
VICFFVNKYKNNIKVIVFYGILKLHGLWVKIAFKVLRGIIRSVPHGVREGWGETDGLASTAVGARVGGRGCALAGTLPVVSAQG